MSDPSINVQISGDVSGVVNVAGRDLIIQQQVIQQIIQRIPKRLIPPSPPSRLIGRSSQFTAIQSALAQNQPVSLHGLGGMGKTALAQSLAADAFAKVDRFPGGVLWITVLNRTLEDLCDDVFRRFEDGDSLKLSAHQKLPLAQQHLGNHHVMVILDDIDDANPAAREWLREVHPVGTPLLVTSRQTQPRFQGFDIAELDSLDAVALLRHHAQRMSTNLPNDLAVHICDALGNHPLAVEITGALLNQGTLDPATLIEQLRESHREIEQLNFGDSKDDNVYASLKLSYERLTGFEKKVLHLLCACFAPQTSDELLSLISGFSDLDRYRQAAAGLYRQSLIRVRGDQWSVHALVRAFVRNTLSEMVWTAMQMAVVTGCVRYASTHNTRTRADHDLLEAERFNLFGAAEFAANHPDLPREVHQLALDLYANSQFLHIRGYSREAIVLLESAVQASRQLRDWENVHVHLNHLGLAHSNLGRWDKAIEAHEQGIEHCHQIGDRSGEGTALGNLGGVYLDRGQTETAIGYFEQALRISREVANQGGEAYALMNLANAFTALRQIERSIQFSEAALLIVREIGDRRGEAKALGDLGLTYRCLGREYSNKVITCYQQALTILREIGDRRGEAMNMFNLGLVLEEQSHIEQAIQYFEYAHRILVEIGSPLAESSKQKLAQFR